MKSILLTGTLVFIAFTSFSQNSNASVDSLDKKLKIKQLEVMDKELEIKLKEFEIKEKELEIEKERFELEKAEAIEEDKLEAQRKREYEVEKKKRDEETQKREDEAMKYKDFNTLIFLDPLPLAIGTFQMGIEKKISPKNSMRLSLGYNNTSDPAFYSDAVSTKGLRVELQYRGYLDKEKPGNSGFYVGAFGVYKTMEKHIETSFFNGSFVQTQDQTVTGTVGSVGVTTGYNLFVINRLTFDFFIGAGMNMKLTDFDTKAISVPLMNPFGSGTYLRTGMSIGLPIKSK